MKVVKSSDEHTIYQKRSGRYAVKGAHKKWINGDDKAAILLAEGLIKISQPQEKPAEPEEAAAGDAEAEA